jgi:predicted ATPase
VTDVADALILRRLFSNLFDHGCVVVATSNRPPEDLYRGGLNRSYFVPFIALLQERCAGHHVDGSVDYRMEHSSSGACYTYPAGAAADRALDAQFAAVLQAMGGRGEGEGEGEGEGKSAPASDLGEVSVPVMMGRSLVLPRGCGRRRVALASFAGLCEEALGAADYLALSENFDVVVITGIPLLTTDGRAGARRFITLIDCLYEHGVCAVFGADVPADQLFEDIDVALLAKYVEAADGQDVESAPAKAELQAAEPPAEAGPEADSEAGSDMSSTRGNLGLTGDQEAEMHISRKGGSSGPNTTMIGNMEWSATGRQVRTSAALEHQQNAPSRMHRPDGPLTARAGRFAGRTVVAVGR